MKDQTGVSRNRACPCGSGKKYKHCCELSKSRRKSAQLRSRKIWKWSIVVVGSLLILYGMYHIPAGGCRNRNAPYYTAANLEEIDFSKLSDEKREKIIDEINSDYCTCGCRLTLAQCVATDKTCPIRSGNITLIRNLVSREGV
ncbi:SEC-C domain-containing protein [bacterium]|nr:SEC-C domain-containing protein [bacterium]